MKYNKNQKPKKESVKHVSRKDIRKQGKVDRKENNVKMRDRYIQTAKYARHEAKEKERQDKNRQTQKKKQKQDQRAKK